MLRITHEFQNYLSNNFEIKLYYCSNEKVFSDEIVSLKNSHWQQKNSEDVCCLLVEILNCEKDLVMALLDNYINAIFLCLYIKDCIKTTLLFSAIEEYGFRMSFESENKVYFIKKKRNIKVLEENLLLNSDSIKIKLEKSWRRVSNLPSDTLADVICLPAVELLTANRFDIAIKALYGRLYSQSMAEEWREKVYYEQALRITGSGKKIKEYDGTEKQGINNFIENFKSLLKEVDYQDIPYIPIDKDLNAFDGSHRIASALVMNRWINAVRLNKNSSSIAKASFFSYKRNGHLPCSVDVMDESAIEYCRLKKSLLIALIFPTISSKKFALNELSTLGSVVYKKDIYCSSDMGRELLKQAYLGHSWLKPEENSKGFINKAQSCFPFAGVLSVILIDEYEVKNIRTTKATIRKHYGIGNHCLHITDSDEETLRLSKVVFNNNSVDLLKVIGGNSTNFHRQLFAYRDWINANNLDAELFCISGSAILSLINIRECNDIDFLFHGDEKQLPNMPYKVECHNHQAKYYDHNVSDIVGNPNLHCWYMGIKFCTPQLIYEMKKNRGEMKDYKDVSLLLSKLSVNNKIILRVNFYFIKTIMRVFFNLKRIVRYLIRKIL